MLSNVWQCMVTIIDQTRSSDKDSLCGSARLDWPDHWEVRLRFHLVRLILCPPVVSAAADTPLEQCSIFMYKVW